jgi:uncharacterized damage-inducible protein DinB
MSAGSPYAKYLEGKNILDVLAATTGEAQKLIATLGPEKATKRPAPDKWSAHEVVSHLVDCDLVFGFRFRQAVAEDIPAIQPFDQDKWAQHAGLCSTEQMLALFAALRAWNLAFIRATLPNSGARKLIHPKRGEMTYAQIVEMAAGHDLNHLEQIRRITGA